MLGSAAVNANGKDDAGRSVASPAEKNSVRTGCRPLAVHTLCEMMPRGPPRHPTIRCSSARFLGSLGSSAPTFGSKTAHLRAVPASVNYAAIDSEQIRVASAFSVQRRLDHEFFMVERPEHCPLRDWISGQFAGSTLTGADGTVTISAARPTRPLPPITGSGRSNSRGRHRSCCSSLIGISEWRRLGVAMAESDTVASKDDHGGSSSGLQHINIKPR